MKRSLTSAEEKPVDVRCYAKVRDADNSSDNGEQASQQVAQPGCSRLEGYRCSYQPDGNHPAGKAPRRSIAREALSARQITDAVVVDKVKGMDGEDSTQSRYRHNRPEERHQRKSRTDGYQDGAQTGSKTQPGDNLDELRFIDTGEALNLQSLLNSRRYGYSYASFLKLIYLP